MNQSLRVLWETKATIVLQLGYFYKHWARYRTQSDNGAKSYDDIDGIVQRRGNRVEQFKVLGMLFGMLF